MTIVKFPTAKTVASRVERRAERRAAASKPRNSKNGTPEERAAARANGPFRKVPFKPRRSKNGAPEERAAKKAAGAAVVELRTEGISSRKIPTGRPKIIWQAPIAAPDFPTEPKAS
jgi:hypothetical protein